MRKKSKRPTTKWPSPDALVALRTYIIAQQAANKAWQSFVIEDNKRRKRGTK